MPYMKAKVKILLGVIWLLILAPVAVLTLRATKEVEALAEFEAKRKAYAECYDRLTRELPTRDQYGLMPPETFIAIRRQCGDKPKR